VNRDLERILRELRLDVASIGVVHGLNGSMDDLRAALRKAGEGTLGRQVRARGSGAATRRRPKFICR